MSGKRAERMNGRGVDTGVGKNGENVLMREEEVTHTYINKASKKSKVGDWRRKGGENGWQARVMDRQAETTSPDKAHIKYKRMYIL